MSELAKLQQRMADLQKEITIVKNSLPGYIETDIIEFFDMLEAKYGIIRRNLTVCYYVSDCDCNDDEYQEINYTPY